MSGIWNWKRRIAAVAGLLCMLMAGARAEAVVGDDIAPEEIDEFYYTVDAPLAESFSQRYRYVVEDGARRLYHESRQGDAWPLTEEDAVASGTVALTDEDWAAFCDCLRGGTVKRPSDEVIDGDEGPWMFVSWAGDGGEAWEFAFASSEKRAGFEALSSRLAGNHVLTRFRFTRGGDMAPRSWEIALRKGRWWIQGNDGEAWEMDPALAEELLRIVAECDLEAWDGFHGSNPNVLDGESFSLELGYADGASVSASGENAFPEGYFGAVDRLNAVFEAEDRFHIAGTYRYEGEGFGGDFTITLNADGTYTFYEGPLSSYLGGGSWFVYDNAVYMTEENGLELDLMFGVEDGALIYLETGAGGFIHVKVSDGERFVRQDGEA